MRGFDMRYEVVGNHTVDGVAPGGVVVIDDPSRARLLVRGGHIRRSVPKHECEECGDEFDSARGLASHGRVHSEDD